jgi:dTDP-4-amino-4,6-dideoxy-D-galactose acyltransferase
MDRWAKANRVDCLYFLADGSDRQHWSAVEGQGYQLVDLRVTYQLDLTRYEDNYHPIPQIRAARLEDIAQVKKMAADFHQASRFFVDGRFPREKCRELYEIWIERDFTEENRTLWVFEEGGVVLGYTSASSDPSMGKAEIGLVGVKDEARGRGIGVSLQHHTIHAFKKMGIQTLKVVTQGRNVNASNLYIKCGYTLRSIDLWFHKWF